MSNVILEKFERACAWNTEKVRGRRKIHDYRIIIDGEHRATYVQASTKWGEYGLKEPGGEWLRIGNRAIQFRTENIEASAEQHLAAGLIPSIIDLARNAEQRLQEKLLKDAHDEGLRKQQRAMDAGPDLLVALKYARRFIKADDADVAFIDEAIARAEG